jgi:hypothetical protein
MSGEEEENVAEYACNVLLCVLNATNVHFAFYVLSHSVSEEKRASIKKTVTGLENSFIVHSGQILMLDSFNYCNVLVRARRITRSDTNDNQHKVRTRFHDEFSIDRSSSFRVLFRWPAERIIRSNYHVICLTDNFMVS